MQVALHDLKILRIKMVFLNTYLYLCENAHFLQIQSQIQNNSYNYTSYVFKCAAMAQLNNR